MDQEVRVLCLGRDMDLGDVYDCREDRLVSGSIWSPETINRHRKVPGQSREPTSEFTLIAEDTASSSTDALDLKGELKLSVLTGLIDVNGAASYLNKST